MTIRVPTVHFNGIDPAGRKIGPAYRLGRDRAPSRRPGLAGRALPPRFSAEPAEQDLRRAGWGVIFGPGSAGAIRRALAPLLRHRRREAGPRFRDDLRWSGRQTLDHWIQTRIPRPYYLLIVGDAGSVPFELQFRLEEDHAVGRICFSTPAEYRAYARQLVAHERELDRRGRRRVAVFAPRTPNDAATKLIADDLAVPLARWFGRSGGPAGIIGRAATKQRLSATLLRPPAVLVTTSHGYARLQDYYYIEDPALRRAALALVPWSVGRARAENGAIVCQDWPGFEAGGLIPRAIPTPAVFFAGDDVPADTRLLGMVAILIGCFTAGTPRLATYPPIGRRAPRIADRSFVARLPQCLLRQGAIAVIGHVEQASADTMRAPLAASRSRCFRQLILRVLDGERVGSAMGELRTRAEYFQTLRDTRATAIRPRPTPAARAALAAADFAFDDARNFILIGDPAGRRRPGR